MAPQKRARRDEDEEVIAMESASSALRHDAQRKKARLSVNVRSQDTREQSAESLSSHNDNYDESLPDSRNDTPLPPATQYEIQRDGNWEHLDNQEEDDRLATQRFLKRKEQIGDNHAAHNAIIEEITCINFMCHERLHVKLGPLINFVVGMNGSGKSAVLTAITLCLGGKTAATNRGASLKSLIKGGTDQAILIIKMKNQGSDAYQPDIYGESIIIERHFSKSGTSGYKLKTANGRIVSSKKGDMDDIVEYYQLQVDNPMNVLTQDAAKSFITRSTPKHKYKFFVEGVQLEALNMDYKMVSEICDAIDAKLAETKGDVKILKKKAEVARTKAELVAKHGDMRVQATNLSKQAAWAQVEMVERKLVEREAMVSRVQDEIDRQERTAEEKGTAFQRVDGLWEQAKEATRCLEEEMAPFREEEETAKMVHQAATKDVQEAHIEHGRITQSLKEGKKKVAGYQKDIQKEMKRMEDVNGGSLSRKLAEIEQAILAATQAKAALEQNQSELPRLDEKKRALLDALQSFDGILADKFNEVESARRRLNDLNPNREGIMAAYDRQMPQLLHLIRQERGFREEPIGPLGLHITLLKPMWSSIIEKTLGTALNGFIVTSKSDQAVLAALMRRAKITWTSPISIVNNSRIDTTGHEPDPQHETIMRVLEIDNDLIKRQLIIGQFIEQSILVRDRSEAQRVMYDGPKPRNVRQCFVINPNTRGTGLRLGYGGRNGLNLDISPVDAPRGKPRMKTDLESQITYQRETVNQLERETINLKNQQRQAQQSYQTQENVVARHNKTHDNLKLNIQRAEDLVESLQAELDRNNVEDGLLDALKGYLADAEREVAIDADSYGNAGLERQKYNSIAVEKKRELDAIKERLVDHEAKIKKAQLKAKQVGQARKIALQEKNNAITLIEEFKARKVHAEEQRDAQAAQVEDWSTQARQVCERVPVDPGETAKTIDVKLSKLRDQLKIYRRRQGASDEDINNASIEAEERYQTLLAHQLELLDLLGLLKQCFMKRIEMYRRFQQHISARSRINFNYLLSERAFRGKLTIDHKNQKLDVHVEPDETTKSGKGRQTKTLSGGEKSFSNICLLLSLWEAMGPPLRCLDEFDVFMDDVNRDVSTKMIISAARRSVGRQFILITPKALGAGAADADDVHIIKLFDPRDRNQRRIDEMVQEQ